MRGWPKDFHGYFVIVARTRRDYEDMLLWLFEKEPDRLLGLEPKWVRPAEFRAVEGLRVGDFMFSDYASHYNPHYSRMYEALYRSKLMTNYRST